MFDPTLTYALIALENAALAVVVVLMATFFTVEQRTAAIVQRFGKSVREESPTRRTKFATP
jgi:regulator of protease activity HflC (stomatin/prohibitin superfamily)